MSGLADEDEPGTEGLAGLSKVDFSSTLSHSATNAGRALPRESKECSGVRSAGGDWCSRSSGMYARNYTLVDDNAPYAKPPPSANGLRGPPPLA